MAAVPARVLEEVSSVTGDGLPFTAGEATRQQAILDAEFAAGWFEPPPEEWQLAGVQGGPPGDPGPGPGEGVPGGAGAWAGEPPWLPGENPPAAPAGPGRSGGPAEAGRAGAGPGPGRAGRGDDGLAGVILAARRCESRALAGLLAATGELHRRRVSHPDRRVGEHAAGELAILMTLTGRAAIGLMGQAAALRRLPATMAALRAGRIDRARAGVIAYETELLDDDAVAAAVELLVIEDAPGLDPARLRRRLRRAVAAADPGAARRRKEQAARDARVELVPEQSGNAGLAGRELPPAAAIAADARIDAAARALKAAGVKARLTQLRAAVFLSLLTGSDPLQFLPPGTNQTDSTSDTDTAASSDADPAPGSTRPAGASTAGASTRATPTSETDTANASGTGGTAGTAGTGTGGTGTGGTGTGGTGTGGTGTGE